jgi:hypothetical protein
VDNLSSASTALTQTLNLKEAMKRNGRQPATAAVYPVKVTAAVYPVKVNIIVSAASPTLQRRLLMRLKC